MQLSCVFEKKKLLTYCPSSTEGVNLVAVTLCTVLMALSFFYRNQQERPLALLYIYMGKIFIVYKASGQNRKKREGLQEFTHP
jgi:hypothetical protein